MKRPLVSIIVPCFNQAEYLEVTLQSVLEQTFSDWECIIVNDGSPDNTEEIAKKWVDRDERFTYCYQKNGGLSSARNLGLANCHGDFIQFLDSDDVLDYKKLELSLNECKKTPEKNNRIVISNFRMFANNIQSSSNPFCELKPEFFTFQNMLFGWDYLFAIPIHCGFFEAQLFSNFRFNEELKAKEDWVMWLSLFLKEPSVSFINKPLVFYRSHPNSMTKEFKRMEENYVRAIVYLKKIIPEKVYSDYLLFALQNRSGQVVKLKEEIRDYKNSKGYKVIEKLKKFTLLHRRLKS